MRKSNTSHLRIATSNTHWSEINNQISHAVANLVENTITAEHLLLLVDLMTNERYDSLDRSMIVSEVQHEAIKYTEGFSDLLASTIERISPSPQRLAKTA